MRDPEMDKLLDELSLKTADMEDARVAVAVTRRALVERTREATDLRVRIQGILKAKAVAEKELV